MRDRSAALVDIMSFLFLFALVLFVTSTDGAIEPPQRPTRFMSIDATAVMSGDERLTVRCQPLDRAGVNDVADGELVLSIFLRVNKKIVAATEASQNCFSDSSLAGETVVARLLLGAEVQPEEVILLPSHIGSSVNIGSVQPLEIRVNGRDFCSRASLDPTIGGFGPVVLESSGSCS
ncbi:MAG: hypothetical protein AAF683_01945 [Pseudomonadota bacterium]